MTINITDTNGLPILAKDVHPSKHTRNIIDHAIDTAYSSPTHTTYTSLPMRDGTQRPIIITTD